MQAAVTRGLAVLRCEPPRGLHEWADEHFYLSVEASGSEGRWQTIAYQRAIMGAMANDDIEIVTVQKAKRIGYTQMLTAAVGEACAVRRRSAVVYHPTETDSEDYARDHIDPMLRDVPPVRDALLVSPEKKSPHNKRGFKGFVGAHLHLRGGLSGRAYRMLTKDLVVYDEVDALPPDIDGEGDPFTLGDGRVETSPFPKSIRGSTPKLRGRSHIERSVSEAEIALWRFVSCPGCGELHRLEWMRMRFDAERVRNVRHECPHCEYRAAYAEIADMDDAGRWMDESASHWMDDDGQVFEVESGERVDVRHVAFRIWSAYSRYKTWDRIAAERVAADRKAEAGDHGPLKTWTNTVLGETWEEPALEADEDALFARREEYTSISLPYGVLGLTAGVDVQADRIEACVFGWGAGSECWISDSAKIYGDPSQLELWQDLDAYLFDTLRQREDGQSLTVRATGVDTGYHTDAVYAYCRRRWPRRVFAVKGRSVERDRPIIGAPTIPRGSRLRLFTIGSHNAKSLILQRLTLANPGPGYVHLPDSCTLEFCQQLTAERLILRLVRGHERTEFEQVRQRNEALDMFQYALAGLHLLRPPWMREDASTTAPAPAPRPPEPVTAAPDPARPPRRRQVRSSGRNWVKSWR